ncbi:MAG: 50S ribosomal protein L25 [Candidatus Omnitrophica bacterium ADurb.Bin277]|nr:MAG: 50S ribosomal protein L25 [Candidatus Omnitrophica bacterium ADurb.Bin277]
METFELQGKIREAGGSRKARNIRRRETIPAIIYGHGMKPLSLEVSERELNRALRTSAGENVMISLKVEGVELKESTCLIKAIQHNPITDKIDHVDFMVISMTEKIKVKVPVVVAHADEAPGVKEGGVLDVVLYEVEVECLPTQIPEKIEIDASAMKINDTVHIKELALAEGVQCLLDAEDVVITIHPPREEEVAPAEEAAAQPEVIEKGKKEKEGEEGAAPKAAAPAKEAK